MLKIYGRANSINVRKVLWTVEEIGLPFTREDWGRGYRPTSDPEFLKLNPFAVVPVIDDDGFILRESHAISRYLAAKHGRTDLYPTDPKTRARSRRGWTGVKLTLPGRPRPIPRSGREVARLPGPEAHRRRRRRLDRPDAEARCPSVGARPLSHG